MLRPDPHLPFLDLAWSPSALGRLLGSRVLPAVGRGSELDSAAIGTMRYTPGRSCVVLLELRFHDDVHACDRAVVTFAKDDRLDDVYSAYYSGGRADETTAVLLPEYRCLVELFPADWRLPALAHAMRGNGSHPGRAQESPSPVRVLRYRPHRRCVLLHGEGSDEVVGKVYGPGRQAADVFARQDAIRARAAGFDVPRPLKLAADVVLMERVPGTSLKELFGRVANDGDGEVLARRAAASLAAFHGVRLATAESRSFADDVKRVQKPVGRLAAVAPEFAARADGMLARLAPVAEAAPAERSPALVHGDFKPGQLLVDGDRMTIVDLDRACIGEPALDVGNFLAQFRKEALLTGNEGLRRLARPFVDEYLRRAPCDGLADRARAVEALALVRMAVRRLRLDPAGYAAAPARSLPNLLLAEAALCQSGRDR